MLTELYIESILSVSQKRLLDNTLESEERERAVQALLEIVRMGSGEALQTLIDAMDIDDSYIRRAVHRAIVWAYGENPELFRALGVTNVIAVDHCVLGINQQADDNFWYSRLKEDSSHWVRVRAALYLLYSKDEKKAEDAMLVLRMGIEEWGMAHAILLDLEDEYKEGRVSAETIEGLLRPEFFHKLNDYHIRCIARFAKRVGLQSVIQHLMEIPDPSVKVGLIEACNKPLDAQEIEMLLGFLDDESHVAFAAASKLLSACDSGFLTQITDRVAAALLRDVDKGPSASIAAPVELLVQAYKSAPTEKVQAELDSFIQSPLTSGRMRAAALAAVAGNWEYLWRLADDKDAGVRIAVARAISAMSLEDEEAQMILLKLWKDTDNNVCRAAARELVQIAPLWATDVIDMVTP